MKILKKFADLIKSGEKTIELRKLNEKTLKIIEEMKNEPLYFEKFYIVDDDKENYDFEAEFTDYKIVDFRYGGNFYLRQAIKNMQLSYEDNSDWFESNLEFIKEYYEEEKYVVLFKIGQVWGND